MLLKANIMAKVSFLDQIPNLAYAYTTIDTWLKTFFATPALAPTAPKGPPPPPSTNMATGTGGRRTGVIGKVQTHLITTYFHALPRKQPPVCQPASQPACLATSEPKVQLQAPPPSQRNSLHSTIGPPWLRLRLSAWTTLQQAGQLKRILPQRRDRMCKRKPTSPGEMGDTIYGMNVSFVDHLDIGLSLRAVLLLLLIIGALCACRKGLCLKWILGKRFIHLHQPPTPANLNIQQSPSTAINMTATAPAPSHLLDTMDEEIAALQKRNQLIELQQRRSQLMEQVPMRANPGNKYPVM